MRSERTSCEAKNRICLTLSSAIKSYLLDKEGRIATEAGGWNKEYCALLSVKPMCGLEELTDAWRSAVKMWHPDRLDDMAPELKEFATKKLAAINTAYEQLKRQYQPH
jgi:DnaJ-domain-containing protein 1